MTDRHQAPRAVPHPEILPLVLLDYGGPRADEPSEIDPAALILTCLNCGARMDERKCKLIW